MAAGSFGSYDKDHVFIFLVFRRILSFFYIEVLSIHPTNFEWGPKLFEIFLKCVSRNLIGSSSLDLIFGLQSYKYIFRDKITFVKVCAHSRLSQCTIGAISVDAMLCSG